MWSLKKSKMSDELVRSLEDLQREIYMKKTLPPNFGKLQEAYGTDWEKTPSIVVVRDQLNNIRELVDVCGAALLGNDSADRIQRHVAHILHFFVDKHLAQIEEELANL